MGEPTKEKIEQNLDEEVVEIEANQANTNEVDEPEEQLTKKQGFMNVVFTPMIGEFAEKTFYLEFGNYIYDQDNLNENPEKKGYTQGYNFTVDSKGNIIDSIDQLQKIVEGGGYLYYFAKGEALPRLITLDDDGYLVMSEKPITRENAPDKDIFLIEEIEMKFEEDMDPDERLEEEMQKDFTLLLDAIRKGETPKKEEFKYEGELLDENSEEVKKDNELYGEDQFRLVPKININAESPIDMSYVERDAGEAYKLREVVSAFEAEYFKEEAYGEAALPITFEEVPLEPSEKLIPKPKPLSFGQKIWDSICGWFNNGAGSKAGQNYRTLVRKEKEYKKWAKEHNSKIPEYKERYQKYRETEQKNSEAKKNISKINKRWETEQKTRTENMLGSIIDVREKGVNENNVYQFIEFDKQIINHNTITPDNHLVLAKLIDAEKLQRRFDAYSNDMRKHTLLAESVMKDKHIQGLYENDKEYEKLLSKANTKKEYTFFKDSYEFGASEDGSYLEATANDLELKRARENYESILEDGTKSEKEDAIVKLCFIDRAEGKSSEHKTWLNEYIYLDFDRLSKEIERQIQNEKKRNPKSDWEKEKNTILKSECRFEKVQHTGYQKPEPKAEFERMVRQLGFYNQEKAKYQNYLNTHKEEIEKFNIENEYIAKEINNISDAKVKENELFNLKKMGLTDYVITKMHYEEYMEKYPKLKDYLQNFIKGKNIPDRKDIAETGFFSDDINKFQTYVQKLDKYEKQIEKYPSVKKLAENVAGKNMSKEEIDKQYELLTAEAKTEKMSIMKANKTEFDRIRIYKEILVDEIENKLDKTTNLDEIQRLQKIRDTDQMELRIQIGKQLEKYPEFAKHMEEFAKGELDNYGVEIEAEELEAFSANVQAMEEFRKEVANYPIIGAIADKFVGTGVPVAAMKALYKSEKIKQDPVLGPKRIKRAHEEEKEKQELEKQNPGTGLN